MFGVKILQVENLFAALAANQPELFGVVLVVPVAADFSKHLDHLPCKAIGRRRSEKTVEDSHDKGFQQDIGVAQSVIA